MRRSGLAITLCLVGAVAVVGALVVASRGNGPGVPSPAAEAGSAASAGSAAPAGRVVARALGKLESASEEIGVASDLTGRIVEILVDEGHRVAEGQPLARLDDTLYRAKVAAAEAGLRAAEALRARLQAGARVEAVRRGRALLEEAEAEAKVARDLADRAEKLARDGISPPEDTSRLRFGAEAREARVRALREEVAILENETRPEDLEAAVADAERARRELEAARAELAKTILRSPIAGKVVRRDLRVGEAVSSFQVEPVVTVADTTSLRVRAEVDEIDIGKVRAGQRARAESESFPGLALEGKVIRLASTMGRKSIQSMDPNERQDIRIREVLVEVEGEHDLPLGLRMIVSFVEGAPPDAP